MDKEHLNIHDPHNQHVWADEDKAPSPVKFVALAIGGAIAAYVFVILIFSQ